MSQFTWRSTGGVTIHRYTPFKPYSVNHVGDAMRHGDPGDLARERVKVITGVDTNEGGDKWRSMLIKQAQGETDDE